MATEALRIVVLISGNGSNLQALIDQVHQVDHIPANIVKVISNRPNAYGLLRAKQANIPTEIIDHQHYSSREDFDQHLQTAIDVAQADLVVLAGFMRILSTGFVNHYLGRMLNIHPSLLPAYKGTNTHQRVLDDQQTHHGVSVHFVTPELDDGPVILQAKIRIQTGDTATSLAKKIHEQEHIIYPKAVEWFANKRLSWHDFSTSPQLDGSALLSPILYKDY